MPPVDSVDLAYGIPLIVIVPAIVQIARANGLPIRLAGPAAIVVATALITLGDIAIGNSVAPTGQQLATWLAGGIVYGLAAVGFYSLAPSTMGRFIRPGDHRSQVDSA